MKRFKNFDKRLVKRSKILLSRLLLLFGLTSCHEADFSGFIRSTDRVDLVITAHDHKRAESRLNNIRYVILDALRDDVKHATYMLLQRNIHGYDYEFVKP